VRYRTEQLGNNAYRVDESSTLPKPAMASCPECGSTYVRRIARTPLMRILWSSEHILCSDCGERSLVFPRLRKLVAQRRSAHPQPRVEPSGRLMPEQQV
jgi:DNA-directed RNA polymerase subunit RPC12/RpoP